VVRVVAAAAGDFAHPTRSATADNTPESFDAFMRAHTARQAALAKLTGHAPMAPQR
jgi:hypothetical protein